MADGLRWGILSTGNIAGQFAGGMAGARRGRVVAVGSRRAETADRFAREHDIVRACGSYEDLLAADEVDAVYLALPNAQHHAWTLAALRAGKHVLCEKPLARSAAEAEEMFDAARRSGCVLAEAFMYRSHPLTHAVLARLRSGAIGRLRLVRMSFCFRLRDTASNIRYSRSLAGGALMDVGCYCVNFARHFVGAEPVTVDAVADMHGAGVDEVTVAMLAFPGGVLATFTCGMSLHADNTASLCGAEGHIEIPVPWKPPVRGAAWHLRRSAPPRQEARGSAPQAPPPQSFTVDADRPLYALEADDFAATVRDGVPPRVSAEDSIANMRVLDRLRDRIGLSFPA